MSNLDVAVSSFWQLARHWKQGEKASLQLSCEDGTLHIQLSADLGHPEEPHFPQSPQTPQTLHPSCKRKSPSQLRRQERRKSEAISKAANKMPFEAADNSVKESKSPLLIQKKQITSKSHCQLPQNSIVTNVTTKTQLKRG